MRFVLSDSAIRYSETQFMQRAFCVIVLCVSAIACGQSPQAIRASEAACGQGKGHVRTQILTGPQMAPRLVPGTSLVYFINPSGWYYFKASIAVDGHWITELGRRSHFAIAMQPGEHHLCTRMERWQPGGPYIGLMHIDLQPDHTYYVRIWPTSDLASNSSIVPQFETVNADEGKFMVDATVARVRAGQRPAGGSR